MSSCAPKHRIPSLLLALSLTAWVSQAAAQTPLAASDDLTPVEERMLVETPAIEASANALTLEEALRLAEERAPTLQIARSQTETALLQRFAARMERAPQITITAGAGPGPRGIDRRQPDGSMAEELIYIGGLSLGGEARIIVPISTFGKIKLATELADMGIRAAELAEDVAAIEARYEAFRAYTGLQWYHTMVPILAEVNERLDLAEEDLEDRLDDGDFSARTALRQLTIYRADVVKMEGELKQVGFLAQQAMRLVLDLPADTTLTPFDDAVPARNHLPPVESLVAYAVEHRPDYARLKIAAEAADQAVRLQKRMMAPNAFFQARGSFIYTPTIEGRPGINAVANRFNDLSGELLLGVRWDIQPGRHRAAVRMAEQRAETVRAQTSGAVLALELQIYEAWVEAEQQLNLVIAQDSARGAAQAWLHQRAFQFEQGLASFDDLVEPLKAYYETIGKYYEALLRYKMHVAHLGVMVGWEDPTTLPR